MPAMTVAIIRSAVRDLGDESSAVRVSALEYFNGDEFVDHCKRVAADHQRILAGVSDIVRQDGVRKRKLLNNLIGEINEYG